MTIGKNNDTPVQSQPRVKPGSRNEGGSGRTSEGLITRETVFANCRLIVSR